MNFNLTALASQGLMPGRRSLAVEDGITTFFFDTDGGAIPQRQIASLGLDNTTTPRNSSEEFVPRRLLFGSLYIPSQGPRQKLINVANYSLRQTHVESAVFCRNQRDGSGCRVQKMRLSRTDKATAARFAFRHAVACPELLGEVVRRHHRQHDLVVLC